MILLQSEGFIRAPILTLSRRIYFNMSKEPTALLDRSAFVGELAPNTKLKVCKISLGRPRTP